jgi:hypothetical protein
MKKLAGSITTTKDKMPTEEEFQALRRGPCAGVFGDPCHSNANDVLEFHINGTNAVALVAVCDSCKRDAESYLMSLHTKGNADLVPSAMDKLS